MIFSDPYFSLAFQYYVAGRFALFNSFMPVCGNLLHHAVEFSLKGFLSKSLNQNDLKKLKHNLPEIWQQFKDKVDVKLDKFEDTIIQLHRFEELRYPPFQNKKTAQIEVHSINRENGMDYQVILNEVDLLIFEIARISGVNFEHAKTKCPAGAYETLLQDNPMMVQPRGPAEAAAGANHPLPPG